MSVSDKEICQVLEAIKEWLKQKSRLDEEMQRHHAYNLYLTLLGFRPAFLSAGLPLFDAKLFAKDFQVKSRVGPYFDIVGRDFAYVINPKAWPRLRPLFDRLEDNYSDSETELEKVYDQRAHLIGTILGFDCCVGDGQSPTTYAIEINVVENRKRTEVFAYLSKREHIEEAISHALLLITKATPFFKPCGLSLGFQVDYPWDN